MAIDLTKKAAGKKLIEEWRRDPVKFVRDNFLVEPDKWQAEVLRVFPSQNPKEMRQSLQACVGPGKTTVLGWCGWNFMSCYAKKGSHPKGAAVAITSANLADNLWSEFAKWRSRSPFLMSAFEWTKSRISRNEFIERWDQKIGSCDTETISKEIAWSLLKEAEGKEYPDEIDLPRLKNNLVLNRVPNELFHDP